MEAKRKPAFCMRKQDIWLAFGQVNPQSWGDNRYRYWWKKRSSGGITKRIFVCEERTPEGLWQRSDTAYFQILNKLKPNGGVMPPSISATMYTVFWRWPIGVPETDHLPLDKRPLPLVRVILVLKSTRINEPDPWAIVEYFDLRLTSWRLGARFPNATISQGYLAAKRILQEELQMATRLGVSRLCERSALIPLQQWLQPQ